MDNVANSYLTSSSLAVRSWARSWLAGAAWAQQPETLRSIAIVAGWHGTPALKRVLESAGLM